MKPDWKDAPEWARWLAQDEDGRWWWYESEPTRGNAGKWQTWEKAVVAVESIYNGWRETLEQRPAVQP